MNSLYVYAALLVLAVFIIGCSSDGNAEVAVAPTPSSEESIDRFVCEEAIETWFDLLAKNPDFYETNEETQGAFAEWRDTFC